MHRKIWLPMLLLGVILFSGSGLLRLRFETGILHVLPEGLKSVQALKDFQKYFAQDRQVVVLLRSPEGEVDEDDAAELADYLRGESPGSRVTYQSAFEEDPALFAKSVARIWSYAPPEEVGELVRRIEDRGRLATYLDEVKEGLQNSFDQEEATMAAYDPLGFLKHSGFDVLLESDADFASDDGRLRLLLISRENELSTGYKEDALWIEEIRAQVNGWIEETGYDLSFQLTGGPVYSAEIGAGMERDMSGTITMTSILVGLLFLLMQRSFWQLLMIGFLLGLTFLITLGVGGWVFGTLNLVSVGFAAILLGLVIDYAVVIIRESPHAGRGSGAIRGMVGPSILWAALTTAVVFGVLMLSTFTGVKQLGGLIAIGLLAGAGVMLVFTPIFLEKVPAKLASRVQGAWFPTGMRVAFILLIAWVGAGVVFLSKGVPEVNMDLKMVEPESSEAAAAFTVMQKEFSAWSEQNAVLMVSSSSLERMRSQASDAEVELGELKSNGAITSYQWPHVLVPNKVYYRANVSKLKRLAGLRKEALAVADGAGFTERGLSLDRSILEAFDELPDSPGDLARACADDPLVGLFFNLGEDGEAFFSGRMRLAGEAAPVSLEVFGGLQEKGVSVTGWSILQAILLPHVKRDFYVIFIPSAALLLLILFAVFRSWRETLISIIVLLTALLLVNAAVVLTGNAWNFLSGMAIPLVVGAGIDYSIHLIFALRRQNGDFAAVWNSVGKAICFCGVSTAIGFGSLLFASNEVLRSMGLLCCLGILITMVLSLLVIPGLWKWGHGGGHEG